MDDAAIDDVVSSHLDAWYTHVASWWPPGVPATSDCVGCSSAAVRDVLDLSAWPHDVAHPLATTIDWVIRDVARVDPGARPRITGALARHVADILDILDECVGRRYAELAPVPAWMLAAS